MYRIILFLVLIALLAAGAAWLADQPGEVVLSLGNLRRLIDRKAGRLPASPVTT